MNIKLTFFLLLTFLLHLPFDALSEERIPFRFVDNLLLVEATINGETGEFILDTGAPDLILNQAHFNGIRVPWALNDVVDFNGKASEARVLAVKGFSIGAMEIKKQHALCIDFTSVERLKKIRLLGVIGYAVLKDLDILFDFDQQEVSISSNRGKHVDLFEGTSPEHSFKLRQNGHMLYLVVQAGKKKLRFGIDTGAEVNIFHEKSLKQVSGHFDMVKRVQVKGITSKQSIAVAGALHQLQIDKRPVGTMPVTVVNMSPLNNSLALDLDGILGIPFLKKGRVGLDFKERKLLVWGGEGLLVQDAVEERMEALEEE